MVKKVKVVPPNPNWPNLFRAEADRIAAVLGQEVIAIHHIGSTAIPGIKAKPVLDFLIEVKDIDQVDDFNAEMIKLGYQPRGEYGIPGRRYFSKKTGSSSSHHLHTFQSGNPEVERHLNFIDYMRAHPEDAQTYSRLKEELARKFPEDIEGYIEGKAGFIKKIDKKAKIWQDNCVK